MRRRRRRRRRLSLDILLLCSVLTGADQRRVGQVDTSSEILVYPGGGVVPPDLTMQKLTVTIFVYYFEEAIYLMNVTTNSKITEHVVLVAKGNIRGWIMRVPKYSNNPSTIHPCFPEL